MGEELKNSIKAKLYDFQYTPFMSSVLLSWVVINHKYLLVYFSDYDLEKKLFLLKNWDFALHAFGFFIPYWMNVVVPISFGLFYVFGYPKINKKFYEYTLERNKELHKIKQEIEDETPITQEKARELKREHYKLADERDQALEKLKESQKEHAEALTNALKPLQDEIEAYKVATNVSNTMMESVKTTNTQLETQLSQANGNLSKKIDDYVELEKKVADLERQIASVGVVNATAYIGRVQANSSTTADNEPDSDFMKVVRYFYDSYNITDEESLLNKLNSDKGVAKLVARDIINKLITQKVLSRDSINRIHITPEGTSQLIKTINGQNQE